VNNDTRAAVLAEIKALAERPRRQEGDVSISDLRAEWGVQDATVKSWMQPLIDEGKFVSLMVYDPGSGRSCLVFRKVPQLSEGEPAR